MDYIKKLSSNLEYVSMQLQSEINLRAVIKVWVKSR